MNPDNRLRQIGIPPPQGDCLALSRALPELKIDEVRCSEPKATFFPIEIRNET